MTAEDCTILMVTRSRVKEDIVNSMPVQEINQTASKERTELIKITKKERSFPSDKSEAENSSWQN